MLNEQEVTLRWSQLFKSISLEPEAFERAEQLLDELRPESPLRLRLSIELEELREMHHERLGVAAHS